MCSGGLQLDGSSCTDAHDLVNVTNMKCVISVVCVCGGESMSLTVKMLVSLCEAALQGGTQLGDRGLQVRAALLTQLLLHLQSAA